MERILDETIYNQSHAIRVAYREGKLDCLEQIKELATDLLAEAKINPFSVDSAFEEGQQVALCAVIERCLAIEQSLESKQTIDKKFDA